MGCIPQSSRRCENSCPGCKEGGYKDKGPDDDDGWSGIGNDVVISKRLISELQLAGLYECVLVLR